MNKRPAKPKKSDLAAMIASGRVVCVYQSKRVLSFADGGKPAAYRVDLGDGREGTYLGPDYTLIVPGVGGDADGLGFTASELVTSARSGLFQFRLV